MKSNIGRSHNALTTELNFEVCAVFVKDDRQHDFSDDSNHTLLSSTLTTLRM